MNNYKYFCNKDCEFFPCHKTQEIENFNCLFCFCPLYFLDEECPGNFSMLQNGIKDCSNCLFPHKKENYDFIIKKIIEKNKKGK